MTQRELVMLQSLPLEIKVMKTKERIQEWIRHWGKDNVYVSYSGGKDSEVLVDIARQVYKDILIVFVNTTQEFPETIKQVMLRKKQGYNIEILRPKKSYKQVIEEYGYPVISKEQSMAISRYRGTKREDQKEYRLNGKIVNGKKHTAGVIAKKWHNIAKGNEFKISEKCCHYLKKEPIFRYNKESGKKAIIGTMANESVTRKRNYLQNGCNSFEQKEPQSRPLGFWKEEDIWEYIKENKLEISECYTKHKMRRQGCYGCLFGCHMEERAGDNRIVKLMDSHPKLYRYLMEKLNYKHVMKVLGLRTYKVEQQKLFKEATNDNIR